MKKGYLIGHVTIKDEQKWEEYKNKVAQSISHWNGQLLFRGRISSIFSGDHKHSNSVVISFPSFQALEDWHYSKEYQSIIPLRNEAAQVDLLAYEE